MWSPFLCSDQARQCFSAPRNIVDYVWLYELFLLPFVAYEPKKFEQKPKIAPVTAKETPEESTLPNFVAYESKKIEQKPRIALVTAKETPEESTLPNAEIIFLPTRNHRTTSQLVADTQYHGSSYLFHSWCLSLEELWSWKHAFSILILMAALAKYIHWSQPTC
jgi:hypothetical protein